jgi:hypothetical protein
MESFPQKRKFKILSKKISPRGFCSLARALALALSLSLALALAHSLSCSLYLSIYDSISLSLLRLALRSLALSTLAALAQGSIDAFYIPSAREGCVCRFPCIYIFLLHERRDFQGRVSPQSWQRNRLKN